MRAPVPAAGGQGKVRQQSAWLGTGKCELPTRLTANGQAAEHRNAEHQVALPAF